MAAESTSSAARFGIEAEVAVGEAVGGPEIEPEREFPAEPRGEEEEKEPLFVAEEGSVVVVVMGADPDC